MKNVACYVRVSTDEQKKHGLSVDNQIQALTDFCKDNNYAMVGIYNDAGISARKRYTKRPALLQLLEDCKNGKVDLILFTKLDRWFRSVGDYYEVQRQLDDCRVPWRAIWEDYETETSAGKLKLNVLLSVNQSEADRASERVKSTFEYKRLKGDYVGSAPYGYVKRDSKLYKDENTREGLEMFFADYFMSFDVRHAAKVARNYGFTYTPAVSHRLLKNPIYAGTAKNGFAVEPYITQEQFDLANETIKQNTRYVNNPVQHNEYIFSGLVYCAKCGARMAASCNRELRKKDGTVRITYYYRCMQYKVEHDKTNIIRENLIENYLLEKLDDLIDESIESADYDEKPVIDNQNKKAALEAKLKRLANLYADGDIDIDDYRKKRDNIKSEIALLEVRPPSIPVRLPSNWRDIYNELDVKHKRAFWMQTIARINVYRWEYDVKFR